MKQLTLFLLVSIFFQIGNLSLVAQNDVDTSFPTIQNDPSINLDQLEEVKPEREEAKTDKKNKKAASIGKSQSFFTNIIQGFLVVLMGFLVWWLYQKWQNRERKES